MTSGFSLTQSFRVVIALGWSDFVLKYRGSVLGYAWSLVAPLVKFGVILYIFGPYMAENIPYYALYLFLGIILWEHFAATTTGCITMLYDKDAIIKGLAFPRVLLAFSVAYTNLIVLGTHFVVFVFICMWIGVPWHLTAAYAVITAIQATLLSLGVGMLLASYSLKYRDVPHLWSVSLPILFWLTPIMYPPLLQKTAFSTVVHAMLNLGEYSVNTLVRLFIDTQPLSVLMQDARRAILYPELWGVPTAGHTMGVLTVCATIFLLGLAVFLRRQAFFAEEY